MKLVWSARARRDLHSVHAYIATDNRSAARQWVARLQARARAAAKVPFAGRTVPEVGRAEIREVLLGSYRIVYRVSDAEMVVLAVFEGHRLFPTDAVPSEG